MIRRSIALLSLTILASTLVVTGCGRNPVGGDPSASASASPDPGAAPSSDPGPYPGDPGTDPGTGGGTGGTGGASPAPAPGGGGNQPAPAPAPAKPASRFRPLPSYTPIPAYQAPGGGSSVDPQTAMTNFINLLGQFGYQDAFDSSAVQDVRMQLLPLTRVSNFQFDPQAQIVYQNRFAGFPQPGPSFQQWQQGAAALAQREDGNVSWYVARADLFRSIVHNEYSPTPPTQLVFYKRLNRTGFVVSYTPDGVIHDYGFYAQFTWQDFLAVPNAFLQ